MTWTRLDDGWWSSPKLKRAGRAARGLLSDLLTYAGDKGTDGFIGAESLYLFEVTDPLKDADFKALRKVGMLHQKGDECRCLAARSWVWPDHKGWIIHDFLDWNPAKSEVDVEKAKRRELRDPTLKATIRARDLGRCRYCANTVNQGDRRWDHGETFDHVDPMIAAGADNLVIACRSCNSAKRKRTPEQAGMRLLAVEEIRAAHFAALGEPDPELIPGIVLGNIQDEHADAPGRVGTGRDGSVSSFVVGPPTTKRDSQSINPYQRVAHQPDEQDLPPPDPLPTVNSPPVRRARPNPPKRPTKARRRKR